MAFGLKMHRYPKDRTRQRVDELLNLVGLAEHGEVPARAVRRDAAAGGPGPGPGPQPRGHPAGRAVVSALDAKIRVKLRRRSSSLQTDLDITTSSRPGPRRASVHLPTGWWS